MGLFWLWSGAVWNVEFLFYGALICSFGLSFPQAIPAILIGNLAYMFLGFASLPAPDRDHRVHGQPRSLRPQRQPRPLRVQLDHPGGFRGPRARPGRVRRRGDPHQGGCHQRDTAAKVVIIIPAVVVQFVVPFLGHATIKTVLRYLSFVFIVIFAVMAVLVLPNAHWSGLQNGVSWWVWTTALVLIVSTGGLGWTENAADYSRYLPKNTSKARVFWAASLGAAIPSILLDCSGCPHTWSPPTWPQEERWSASPRRLPPTPTGSSGRS